MRTDSRGFKRKEGCLLGHNIITVPLRQVLITLGDRGRVRSEINTDNKCCVSDTAV